MAGGAVDLGGCGRLALRVPDELRTGRVLPGTPISGNSLTVSSRGSDHRPVPHRGQCRQRSAWVSGNGGTIGIDSARPPRRPSRAAPSAGSRWSASSADTARGSNRRRRRLRQVQSTADEHQGGSTWSAGTRGGSVSISAEGTTLRPVPRDRRLRQDERRGRPAIGTAGSYGARSTAACPVAPTGKRRIELVADQASIADHAPAARQTTAAPAISRVRSTRTQPTGAGVIGRDRGQQCHGLGRGHTIVQFRSGRQCRQQLGLGPASNGAGNTVKLDHSDALGANGGRRLAVLAVGRRA